MAKRAMAMKKGPAEPEASGDRFAAYLDLGRKNQKLRTRDALVSVAATLIRQGQPISVTEVADAARVSRTTAYRYFPTSDMLAAQATLTAAAEIEPRGLEKIADGPGTIEEKIDAIIVGSHSMTTDHERSFRALLRFTVEAGAEHAGMPPRPAFRRMWIEGVLAPLKKDLGAHRFNRVVCALCLLCGIEPVVVLSDVCRMSDKDALDVKRWSAQQLLRAAIDEAGEAKGGKRKAAKARS